MNDRNVANWGTGMWSKGAAALPLRLTEMGNVCLLLPELSFAPKRTPNIGIHVKSLGF